MGVCLSHFLDDTLDLLAQPWDNRGMSTATGDSDYTPTEEESVAIILEGIRIRDARDHGIPWSGPQAEIAHEFVEDRHFLLELVGKLQEAVMNLAIELKQNERLR
jgi:hypothetical protein